MSTNHDKIMEKLGEIHSDVAVLKEQNKVSNIRISNTNARVEKVETKLRFHDKIVGAVCLASGILITLIKYGKL